MTGPKSKKHLHCVPNRGVPDPGPTSDSPSKTRVVVYMATCDPVEPERIDPRRQLNDLLFYVTERPDWEVVEWIDDSGSHDREKLLTLLEEGIDTTDFDVLLVHHIACLCEGASSLRDVLAILTHRNIRIVSATEPIDTDGIHGDTFIQLTVMFADFEDNNWARDHHPRLLK